MHRGCEVPNPYANQSINLSIAEIMRIPVAAWSKASFCGSSLGGIVVSKSRRGHRLLSVLIVVCCQVEVSATG